MTKRKRTAPAAMPAAINTTVDAAAPRLPARVEDITGQKFGRLTVLGLAGYYVSKNGKSRDQRWRCACACGRSTAPLASNLHGGRTKSCGCTTRSHGRSQTPEYTAWISMRRRCAANNSKRRERQIYFRRGIKVCKEWCSESTLARGRALGIR